MINRTGRRRSRRVQRDDRHILRPIAGERRRAVAEQIRAPGIEGLDRKRERRDPGRRADGGALEADAIGEPVFGDRSLQQVGVGVEWLEARSTRPCGPTIAAICMVKNPMCPPTSIAQSPGASVRRTNRDLVLLVLAAQDVQADHVIRQVDEQPHAWRDLLDHDRRVVGVGEIGVLVAEFGRGDQVVPELGGRSRDPASLGPITSSLSGSRSSSSRYAQTT